MLRPTSFMPIQPSIKSAYPMAPVLLGVGAEAAIFQGTTRGLKERHGGNFHFMKIL